MKKESIIIIVLIIAIIIIIVGGIKIYRIYQTISEDREMVNCTSGEDDSVIYRWSTEYLSIGDNISSLKKGKDYVTCKSQVEKMNKYAKKHHLEQRYYLKHNIQDNTVTDSYVCFKITEELVDNNTGMKEGEYCINGGDEGLTYETNKSILKSVFNSKECRSDYNRYENYYTYSCSAVTEGRANFRVGTKSNGGVFSNDADGGCYVNPKGGTICEIDERGQAFYLFEDPYN